MTKAELPESVIEHPGLDRSVIGSRVRFEGMRFTASFALKADTQTARGN